MTTGKCKITEVCKFCGHSDCERFPFRDTLMKYYDELRKRLIYLIEKNTFKSYEN